MHRYLEKNIREDLNEKMVFVGGPRQVGKTTLAFYILNANEAHPAYKNWDIIDHQKSLMAGELPANQKLIVLDEIHKYKNWRNLVKGFYDGQKSKKQFLITGSARLDYFRKGGDSLQGRYHYYRLHPLSLYEIGGQSSQADLQHLLQFGGFPEPFLKANARHWKRWQQERNDRVIQEDLISLEQVKDISQLKLLQNILPGKVGNLLSLENLRKDLNVAFETADKWTQIFENLYYCFRIQAYGFSEARAAKKEKKLYLWDWSLVEKESARKENLIASLLLKYCHFKQDTEGDKYDLHFYRDSIGRDIDFIVLKNKKPLFAVECKSGDESIASNLKYFSARLPIPLYYQVHFGKKHNEIAEYKTEIIPFIEFSKVLGV